MKPVLKSPVREIRTPGSVGVRATSWVASLPGGAGIPSSSLYLLNLLRSIIRTFRGHVYVNVSQSIMQSWSFSLPHIVALILHWMGAFCHLAAS